MLADAQQRLGVAAIEGMELAELAGQKIARPLGRHVLVDREAAVGLAGQPGVGRREPRLLARVGVGGQLLCAGKITSAAAWPSAEFIDSMRLAAITGSMAQRLFLVGGGR